MAFSMRLGILVISIRGITTISGQNKANRICQGAYIIIVTFENTVCEIEQPACSWYWHVYYISLVFKKYQKMPWRYTELSHETSLALPYVQVFMRESRSTLIAYWPRSDWAVLGRLKEPTISSEAWIHSRGNFRDGQEAFQAVRLTIWGKTQAGDDDGCYYIVFQWCGLWFFYLLVHVVNVVMSRLWSDQIVGLKGITVKIGLSTARKSRWGKL